MGRRNRSPELAELREDASRARGISALATLIRGRKHTRESTIPGSEIAFVWRVLGGREKQECLARAIKRFEDLGIPSELRTYTDLEDELTWQMVAAGMRSPDNEGDDSNPYPDALGTPDEVRDALTVDERDILISEYMDLEELVDPDPVTQPDAWHNDVMAALKKSLADMPGAVSILSNLGSRALIGFLVTTVAPQLSSLIGRSESTHTDGTNTNETLPHATEPAPGASE